MGTPARTVRARVSAAGGSTRGTSSSWPGSRAAGTPGPSGTRRRGTPGDCSEAFPPAGSPPSGGTCGSRGGPPARTVGGSSGRTPSSAWTRAIVGAGRAPGVALGPRVGVGRTRPRMVRRRAIKVVAVRGTRRCSRRRHPCFPASPRRSCAAILNANSAGGCRAQARRFPRPLGEGPRRSPTSDGSAGSPTTTGPPSPCSWPDGAAPRSAGRWPSSGRAGPSR